MRKATLHEVRKLAEQARRQIWLAAEDHDRDAKIYLHWSAGHYGQFYDDYHINIDKDGSIYVATEDFSDVLAHTWRRNSGSIGISLACCAFATSSSLGDEPPTKQQIEVMAQCIAVVAEALWLTIDKAHVLTHGEAADNEDGYEGAYDDSECYGPKSNCERWDLEYLETDESPCFDPDDEEHRGGAILRGKANWYRNKWNAEKV